MIIFVILLFHLIFEYSLKKSIDNFIITHAYQFSITKDDKNLTKGRLEMQTITNIFSPFERKYIHVYIFSYIYCKGNAALLKPFILVQKKNV